MVMSLLDLLEKEKDTVENIKRAESIIERYKKLAPNKDKNVKDFFQSEDLKKWYFYIVEATDEDPTFVTYDMYAIYLVHLTEQLDEIQNQLALYFENMKGLMKIAARNRS